MDLKALALKVIEAKQPAKPALKIVEKGAKLLPENNIEKFSSNTAVPYLDDQGRFCVRGGLHREPILDRLIELNASDEEIMRHIGPIHQAVQWKRWQQIKTTR